jgi:hypothetical protein
MEKLLKQDEIDAPFSGQPVPRSPIARKRMRARDVPNNFEDEAE